MNERTHFRESIYLSPDVCLAGDLTVCVWDVGRRAIFELDLECGRIREAAAVEVVVRAASSALKCH